ncbi:hypothetical protein KIM322_07160 [Lactobacillus xylocopicola]|uniref:Uncharacterized protein n=1 Tax=Lactobacillus xylocopicola TaxID=2976676 RepID=A0ABM8BGP5_9LACO|nr:hypothetical protein KIM322_07160 [Lactobacillus xylocopicola]
MFLLLGILILSSILQPALVFARAEDMSNSVSIAEQAKKAFIESKEYKKFKKFKKY